MRSYDNLELFWSTLSFDYYLDILNKIFDVDS